MVPLHQILTSMKSLAILFVFGFILALSTSSCKSHETCPAYGQVEQAAELPG